MRKKKEYKIDDILPVRLTEKAGATDEVFAFLNSLESGEVGQTMIKALKYWCRTQGGSDRVRKAIEDEARVMNMHNGRYGRNRGPYKKEGDTEEIRELKQQLKAVRKKSKGAPKADITAQPPTPSRVEIVEPSPTAVPTTAYTDAEDELYGGHTPTTGGNPMQRALKSIPRPG